MGRYELPEERCVPGKLRLALVTLAYFGVLGVLFFGSVGILAFILSWAGSLLGMML